MKTFLLIDDHVVVRSGIKNLLSEIFMPAKVDEAGNEKEAVEMLKKNDYDLVITDVQMPDSDTVSLVEFIGFRQPDAKVLVFSMSSEKIYAPRFIKAGAKGFISKEAPLDELVKAINVISNGRMYISDTLAVALAQENILGKGQTPFSKLSQREFEIATMLLDGKSSGEISKTLNLHASTIGTHKARIFEKLAITNIVQLKELATNYNM